MSNPAGTLGAVHLAASNEPDLLDRRVRSALRRNNLPLRRGADEVSPPMRVLTSPWFWGLLLMLALQFYCLRAAYLDVVPDRQVPGGTLIGMGTEALKPSATYAAYTVIPLSLLILWADRFRPHNFLVWLVTFGWGGTVAVFASLRINTWAATLMSVVGDGNPAAASRPAVYIAPFVEEAAKGSVLFLIAIFLRYRWVSKLSGIVLAGLSAAAFAFVENIFYYGQAYRAAARTTGAADPEEVLASFFVQRGVLTFFAHPLFTIMIGIGLAIALRSRSKVVRIMAPLTGFLAAALLHMLFNGTVSMGFPTEVLFILLVAIAYPMVITLIIFIVRQLFRERTLIRSRLTDYARVGWLPESDAHWVSRLTTRVRVLWQALWEGRPITTWRMQRALTELAYLRDSMARGLVDDAGLVREKQLLLRARRLRDRAIVEPRSRTSYPWQRLRGRKAEAWAPPAHPGPAGLAGSLPALPLGQPTQSASGNASHPGVPLGSGATTYSPVDPRWKPPSP